MFTLWGGSETLKSDGLKKWKQPKCPSADEWTNRMWYRHRTEHYSAIKRNEVPVLIYSMDGNIT